MKKSTLNVVFCFFLSLVALFALGIQVSAADQMSLCAKHCSDCQTACEKASAYCKTKGGPAASADREQKFADCIELCKTSHNLLQRESKYHPDICKLCAKACKECDRACET